MPTCIAHTTPDAFDALADEWRALLATQPFDTLFLTPEWQRLTFGEFQADKQLLLLTVRDDVGLLLGLAPLAYDTATQEIAFACYKEISDYLDLLVRPGHQGVVYAALTDWLKTAAAPQWTRLNLTNIVETSPSFAGFAEALRVEGWQVDTPIEDVCPVITLPASFDAYLEMLDGKERRELQRKMRRASEESRVVFSESPDTLATDIADFITLMKASMITKNDFMTPTMEAYFHKMAGEMQRAGWLQLAFLEVGDEEPLTRAAAFLNFVYNNQVLIYNSGLDPAKFAHLSPGQVLLARLIEHAIAGKRVAFDFLQGNESYKYKLGGKDVTLRSLICSR
jgi:CelD/BcsL family acetyltransferase involved in cellulose biosynthesis